VLQLLRTTKASQTSATAETANATADLPRRHLVVHPHDQHSREEHRQIEGHHGDGGIERRAALHDLDIERHSEIERGFQRHDGEHGVDRGALLGRIDHVQGEQRRFARRLPPVRPPQESLAEHDADDDHDRRG